MASLPTALPVATPTSDRTAASSLPTKCQVTGCKVDLSDQCQYNRRYKICDEHRKQLSVDMNGTAMRFCQQCARLQTVDKFTGDRKSCQARLDIHNRRRAQGKGASAAVALGHITVLKCQVPGCTENLLNHKAYNQRYKICPFHRTREVLDIGGEQVRFCQQCAKLHTVSDFEGTKRSCKEKLERHNNRRLLLKKNLENRVVQPGEPVPAGAFCQIPGCDQDLREMKVYNIRYKVCADHLTMPEVDMNGETVRFCQQCARFHPVDEFDGMKRSCRSRLEKHNQRRRVAAQSAQDKDTMKEETSDDQPAPAATPDATAPNPAQPLPSHPAAGSAPPPAWSLDPAQMTQGNYDPQQLMNALQSMQQLLGAAAANQGQGQPGPAPGPGPGQAMGGWPGSGPPAPSAAHGGGDQQNWMGAALSAMSAAMMYGQGGQAQGGPDAAGGGAGHQ